MDRKRRIIMIDDDQKLTSAYARQLRAATYDVDVANDIGTAVRALQERAYDVAIVDMNLSGIAHDHTGGEAILAFLKTLKEPIAAVVLTSEEDPQFSADLLQDSGISRFVSKGTITKQGLSPLFAAVEMALASMLASEKRRTPAVVRALAGAEPDAIWVDMALRTLSPDGGYSGLASFLDGFLNTFVPLLPGARIRESPMHRSSDGSGLQGYFWSKGQGQAILIRMRAANAHSRPVAEILPEGAAVGEVLKEYSAAKVSGTVWALNGCARSEFAQ
jgi:CheY-like chemotaxis protein